MASSENLCCTGEDGGRAFLQSTRLFDKPSDHMILYLPKIMGGRERKRGVGRERTYTLNEVEPLVLH